MKLPSLSLPSFSLFNMKPGGILGWFLDHPIITIALILSGIGIFLIIVLGAYAWVLSGGPLRLLGSAISAPFRRK